MTTKHNFSIEDMEADFPVDTPIEEKIKNGHKRTCAYSSNGIPTLREGKKEQSISPLVSAFGLNKDGE